MKNREVLCVDLGSAYTKLAVRSDWNESSELVRDIPLAVKEETFCVPSVVARVQRGRRYTWVIGAAAAGQVRGEGVLLCQSWKADLFSNRPDLRRVKGRGERDLPTPADVALQFFRGLRDTLKQGRRTSALVDLPVRVCVPKLSGAGEVPLPELVEEAGWRVAERRATVFEPESNTLGILTRGRNSTWSPLPVSNQPHHRRSLHLERMLDGTRLFDQMRTMGGRFGVLVIDIGAFTTDFGFVSFDISFRTDPARSIHVLQHSVELGVRELDEAVYKEMRPQTQKAIRGLTPRDWDERKAKLYRGEQIALRNPKGGILVVGRAEDADIVADSVRRFAERVIIAKEEFVRSVAGNVRTVILTGGGALIPGVREVIESDVSRTRGAALYNLFGTRRAVAIQAGRGGMERMYEETDRRNQELVRGGSAIGGTSVFFE